MREFRSGDLVKSTTNGVLALLCQPSRLGGRGWWDVRVGLEGDNACWDEDHFELAQRRPYLGEWVSQNGELGIVVEVDDPCMAFTVAWCDQTQGVGRYRTRYTSPGSMAKLRLHGIDVNYPCPCGPKTPEPVSAEEICTLSAHAFDLLALEREPTKQDIFLAEYRSR